MTPAWVEAAKGIPCWRGAMFFPPDQSTSRLCVDVTEPSSFRDEHNTWCSRSDHDSALCVPDLTDPDTRAMYLRRLAVALGCPEEVAADGVVVWTRNSFLIGAGFPDAIHPWDEDPQVKFPWEFEIMLPRCESTEEALALAWPADKRVTT